MKTKIFSLLTLTLLSFFSASSGRAADAPQLITKPIVNGALTGEFPNVGMLLNFKPDGVSTCTGTLIGCQTFLTAAHCICSGGLTGSACRQRPDLLNPADLLLFFQHAGLVPVAAVSVHPDFVFGTAGDLAVLRLAAPVSGVAPAALNLAARPPFGLPGLITGFGVTQVALDDAGLKRVGQVTTGACPPDINAGQHVCWSITPPLGPPGEDSSTCHGDSGGPLFFPAGSGLVLGGVTSGGTNGATCIPPGGAWDTDVFVNRAWIQAQAGGDLGTSACGGLPAAGSQKAPISAGTAALDAAHPEFRITLEVPPGTSHLRVGLNAENPFANDFNLYLSAGSPATPAHFNCKSERTAGLEFCDVAAPAPGTWHLLANRVAGAGPFQLTATLFAGGGTTGACVRDAATACLQSGRFEVQVDWETDAGDGAAQVMSFGGQRTENDESVFWWFFNPSNFEMGVKVLNGCGVNGKYWVFLSGLTNQGWTAHVRDTRTGAVKTYSNDVGDLSETFGDTAAFNCQ